MKKIIVFASTALLLASCGGEAEEATEETNDTADSTEVEVVEEIPPTPTELAIGSWTADIDKVIANHEAETGQAVDDLGKEQMQQFFGDQSLDLNENGTFEMMGMLRDEMNGAGLWVISEAGDTLTFTYDAGEIMPCEVTYQTENELEFNYTKTTSSSESKTGWVLKRK